MLVREVLNRNPKVTGGVAAGVIALVLIIWLVQWVGSRPDVVSEARYSTDDGASYFAGGLDEFPPFMKDGKEAVRAYVFRCKGTDPFVGYLERYTQEAKQRLEKLKAMNPEDDTLGLGVGRVGLDGVEVKKPGEKQWVSMAQERYENKRVTVVTCPDGTTEGLQPELP